MILQLYCQGETDDHSLDDKSGPDQQRGYHGRRRQCTLNFDPILDEIFREWSVVTAAYYVVTAIPKLRKIWSFRALAAFWVSLWSTSVCQAVAAVHSVVRRLHRGLTRRHSHNNIKHHSISSNIQFRLSTKASLNIFGLFISVWGGFPSNIGSHAELIHCALRSPTI